MVLFDGSRFVVGREAVREGAFASDCVADSFKREIGRTYYPRPLAGERFPPEVLESLVLEKLRRDAETAIGPVRKCVVTVPAFFDEPRRKATQDAGRLALLDVLEVMNEPTAAAIAYGHRQGFLTEHGASLRPERMLVFDLGGGTFDVSVMSVDGRDFRCLATAGDVFLGGIDWDERLAALIAEKLAAAAGGRDLLGDPATRPRLLREAEAVKRSLSAAERAVASFEIGGRPTRATVTRAEFEEGTAALLYRTQFTSRRVLQEAGLNWSDLTRVLLVGGSTRMPMIGRMLEAEFGRPVSRGLAADEAVAHGAALYAALLVSLGQGRAPAMSVRNVNAHDLGVLAIEPATGLSRKTVVIPRNTPLPVTLGRRYRTRRAGQESVAVHVIEGGDAAGGNATPIGTCVVSDLPPGLPAKSEVLVAFTYGNDGRLSVRAKVPAAGLERRVILERPSGLSDAALAHWDERLRCLKAGPAAPC